MAPFILGIDVGTSSVKVGLFTNQLKLLKLARRNYPTMHTPSGAAVQSPDDWWQGVVDALQEISAQYSLQRVEAVGLSGFNALVAIARDGTPCGQALTYQDRRPSVWQGNQLTADVAGEIFQRTSNCYTTAGMWAPLLCWMKHNEPEQWRNAHQFVSSSGFLLAKLTGSTVVDETRASLTLLHDPCGKELVWDMELCRQFGLDPGKLPEIRRSWEIVGSVTDAAALQTGLRSGVPVIAGAIDSMCAALGTGVMNGAAILDIGGSAGGLAAVGEIPRPDLRFWTVRYALPGLWASIGPMNTGGSGWKWFVDNLGGARSHEDLLALARAVKPGSDGLTFIPFLAGSRAPYWRMDLRAGFHGVTADHSTGHFARAVMEGVSYCLKDILIGLRDLGYEASEVLSSGGAADNSMWLQMKSDVLSIPYRIKHLEAASVGAAALAGFGTGMLSVDSISGMLGDKADDARVEPNAETYGFYLDAYHLYQRRCTHHLNELASNTTRGSEGTQLE